MIFLKKTQALAWMEQREWELDSWDALVKRTTNSLQTSILRKMDQRCPRGNCPTYTTAAKFQASSTWDPRDEPSAHSQKSLAQFKPLHSSWSMNGGTSNKKAWTEKKKHRHQEQAQNNST